LPVQGKANPFSPKRFTMTFFLRMVAACAVISAIIAPSTAQSGWFEERRENRWPGCDRLCDTAKTNCESAASARWTSRVNTCVSAHNVENSNQCPGGSAGSTCRNCFNSAFNTWVNDIARCLNSHNECHLTCDSGGSCELPTGQ